MRDIEDPILTALKQFTMLSEYYKFTKKSWHEFEIVTCSNQSHSITAILLQWNSFVGRRQNFFATPLWPKLGLLVFLEINYLVIMNSDD